MICRDGQLELQLDDPALDETLALFRRIVFGVFRQIAMGARLGDGRRSRSAAPTLSVLQFGTQFFRAGGRSRGLTHIGLLIRAR